MVVGLEIFSEYFKDHQDCYLVIGGSACDIIIEGAGFRPRATNDIDIILVIEALTPDFVKRFWQFIKDGGYQLQQKDMEKRNCYRFAGPENDEFPQQIELFCKAPDVIDLEDTAHLTPIPVDEGLSSLSAILLNEDYYNYTKEHSEYKDNVHFAAPHAIICLKAYAFLSNTARKNEGQQVRTVDIVKHKHDVFRMVFMLLPDDVFETPEIIKADLQRFADVVKEEMPDPAIFKDNGFGRQDMNAIFNQFLKSFNLNA